MKLETAQFGTISYIEKEVILFEDGLFGFEDKRKFLLIDGGKDSYFSFLQSIDEPGLCFVIANPKEIITDYLLSISQLDYDHLEIKSPEMVEDFVIITIPENLDEISANLLGPIVINCETMKGKQVISQNQSFTTKHKILENLKRLAS